MAEIITLMRMFGFSETLPIYKLCGAGIPTSRGSGVGQYYTPGTFYIAFPKEC